MFLKRHFLRWLEALSLMGKMSEAVTRIRILQRLVEIIGDVKKLILCYAD